MQQSIRPKARKEKLIIKEIDNETLVYDLENDQAHCLNSTAARVWQLCDGLISVSEIAQLLDEPTETKADETVVWLALDQLQKFDLLEEALSAPAHLAGLNRRQWVRNVGMAAIALPVIMSIAAPTPAQTASQCACITPNCRPDNCACAGNVNCVHKCNAGVCGP